MARSFSEPEQGRLASSDEVWCSITLPAGSICIDRHPAGSIIQNRVTKFGSFLQRTALPHRNRSDFLMLPVTIQLCTGRFCDWLSKMQWMATDNSYNNIINNINCIEFNSRSGSFRLKRKLIYKPSFSRLFPECHSSPALFMQRMRFAQVYTLCTDTFILPMARYN